MQSFKKTVFIILAALSVAACSSSDPEYVDPEVVVILNMWTLRPTRRPYS